MGTTIRHYPYGGYRAAPTTGDITDRGFSGHRHNDDIGLIYMRARYYVPGVGRFASADTIVPDPAAPQSFNRYSYVNNRPLSLLDRGGNCPGYPGDGVNDDCWDYLQNEFCQNNLCGESGYGLWIIIDATSVWTKEELTIVRGALLATKQLLQSIGNMNWMQGFGGVRFRRTATSGPAEFRAADNEIALESRWNRPSFDLDIPRIANMFRIVLHEMGHALDYHSNQNDFYSRLSSQIPHETWGIYAYTGSGYWFRGVGYISNNGVPTQAFADMFSAWIWHDSFERGSVEYAIRSHIGVGRSATRLLNQQPVKWSAMYDLMTSMIED